MKIADVYRHHVATDSPTASLRDIAHHMVEHDTGIVVLVDDDHRVLGVVSERDLARALARETDARVGVARQYATTPVLTASLDDDTSDVARRMLDAGVRRLPVVTAEGLLVGIVSMRDLLAIETFMPPAPTDA